MKTDTNPFYATKTSADQAIEHASRIVGVPTENLKGRSKQRNVSKGRALACKWLVKDLGLTGVEAGEHLGITSAAVSNLVRRGVRLETELGVALPEEQTNVKMKGMSHEPRG